MTQIIVNFPQVTEEETELQYKLPTLWEELVWKSKNVDASLITVKKKFTEVWLIELYYFMNIYALTLHWFMVLASGFT